MCIELSILEIGRISGMAKFRLEAGKKEEEKKKSYMQASSVADAGVVEKINTLIEKALEEGATDFHIEPLGEEVVVRMRVHGKLRQVDSFPLQMHGKLVNRFKVMSAMDITKTKVAQNGFFKVVTDEAKIEILTQTIPTVRGEKVYLKIQYRSEVEFELEDLGMIPKMLEEFQLVLKRSNGLLIVAGPPGNGKTTTLYTVLKKLSDEEKSVMTFENVIKYELPGIVQSKPDQKGEFSFESGVEAAIECEPDVLLIGDVQTPEVAKLVVQAAFAKRVVLARMSADNSVNAVQNMIDMGLPPFLVTSAVNAVLAQRLVRRLCEDCKEEYSPPERLLQELQLKPGMKFYRPRGCERCGGVGYVGFVGLFEYFTMKEELKEMFLARESSRRIRDRAAMLGMIPLKKDGIYKACKGLTSIEEVLNVI